MISFQRPVNTSESVADKPRARREATDQTQIEHGKHENDLNSVPCFIRGSSLTLGTLRISGRPRAAFGRRSSATGPRSRGRRPARRYYRTSPRRGSPAPQGLASIAFGRPGWHDGGSAKSSFARRRQRRCRSRESFNTEMSYESMVVAGTAGGSPHRLSTSGGPAVAATHGSGLTVSVPEGWRPLRVDLAASAMDLAPVATYLAQHVRPLPASIPFLDQKPRRARGWIAADSRYRLTINGQRVQWGPAPCDPRQLDVDPVDLAPYLRAGENVIGVEVSVLRDRGRDRGPGASRGCCSMPCWIWPMATARRSSPTSPGGPGSIGPPSRPVQAMVPPRAARGVRRPAAPLRLGYSGRQA